MGLLREGEVDVLVSALFFFRSGACRERPPFDLAERW